MIEPTELTAMRHSVSFLELRPSLSGFYRSDSVAVGRRKLLRTASHCTGRGAQQRQLLAFQNFAAARHGETTRNDENRVGSSERTAVS